MRSSSAGVAARFSRPTTAARTAPWPMKLPMLIDLGSASSLSSHGFRGTGALPAIDGPAPSAPSMIVVTPWRM